MIIALRSSKVFRVVSNACGNRWAIFFTLSGRLSIVLSFVMYEIRVLTVPMDQPARVSLPEKPRQTSTGSDKSDTEERGSTPTSQYLSTPWTARIWQTQDLTLTKGVIDWEVSMEDMVKSTRSNRSNLAVAERSRKEAWCTVKDR